MSTSAYPVHVHAHLDETLSRWQWLVKWLLAIPHYVVLAFLWVAFSVVSVIAFVAILATGRYPRVLFDFNVGVLRWTWRVGYYAYGALGTDRYPPFTLEERPDYPAHLEVDYPEHLSRGLVLVKWWLLAIPHYLVLGLFLGGGAYVASDADADQAWIWNTGLIGLLVLVAAVVLLFTGHYPRPVFDLVLGLNRWVLRVAGYAALMTDRYPPFRLDQGEDDPESRLSLSFESQSTAPSTTPSSAQPAAPSPPSAPPIAPGAGTVADGSPSPTERRGGWTAGRVIALVLGCLMLLGSLGLAGGGAALAVGGAVARDDDGFLMTPTTSYATESYALVSESMEIQGDAPSGLVPDAILGDAKVTATSTDGEPVFVGLAATSDVDEYLSGVPHETVVGFDRDPVYRASGGTAAPAAPTGSTIWVEQSSGPGRQSITWPVEDGDWTVVVMNAEGSPAVSTDLAVGATVPALGWVVAVLVALGVAGLLVATVVIALAVSSAARSARR